jgi:rhamnogalacturonyl hydrolase YesR
MKLDNSLLLVKEFMIKFAYQTGLLPGKKPKRYLWTDAFAVCNFLGLYRQTGEEKYKELALRLVDQVHQVLGKHREDDHRKGWISGLDEEEAKKYPTIGGLRIGKPLPERKPGEPLDTILEWERDGQYYHYLTKWMHALNRVSQVTGDPVYNKWAIELAKTAHVAFTYTLPNGLRRMIGR